ncbi:patatin-like phospholipase family protein [Brachybacterium aquaticum]|uniref:NTE family protein n=1 Tax=Brachybacterium aquaticum TaxID=1432564 RepID=A0A841ADG4_9MICO|nr:patatin-like phospholipase family protein [Brachybacterium aquaticum]MBB5831395.1 NTE family protein [Brachybacterium aquaticum]
MKGVEEDRSSSSLPSSDPAGKRLDLVLEGGGVKGIALVGALEVLEEHGYRVNRVAGSSAGAIAGSMVAAGIAPSTMTGIMQELDYSRFQDGRRWNRYLPIQVVSVLRRKGIYPGRFVEDWLEEQLRTHSPLYRTGTFADLAYADPDPARTVPANEAFRLVVTASDISNGRLRFLPRDFEDYHRSPGEQRIVDAVRISMSIPFFFRPVGWKDSDGRPTWLVDGGMLSNFPITQFDAPAGVRPRWPTLGIKLSQRPDAALGVANRITGTVSFGVAILRTMMGFYDGMHIESADAVSRTIFIDTGAVGTTQFDLTTAERDMLHRRGREAAEKFLDGSGNRAGWDFERYIEQFRAQAV